MLWSMDMGSDNELDFLRPEAHGTIAWWGVRGKLQVHRELAEFRVESCPQTGS